MDFREILKEYKYRCELHAHTSPVSRCAVATPKEVIGSYLTKTEADTIVITNHLKATDLNRFKENALAEFYVKDYYDALEAAKDTGLHVAFGAEIQFAHQVGEFLVYGICPEDIPVIIRYLNKDIHAFYKDFKNSKNLILQAHPFRDNVEPTPLGSVDGIESFNTHSWHNSRIAFACKQALENDLTVSCGSDYHADSIEASSLLCTKSLLRDSYDVAAAISSRDVLFKMHGHLVIPYI